MRAEFLVEITAKWDPHWQTFPDSPDSKGSLPTPDRNHVVENIDELLEGINHDEVCADGEDIIVHDIYIEDMDKLQVIDNTLKFQFVIDCESDIGKLPKLRKVVYNGMMFWYDNWVNDITIKMLRATEQDSE